MDGCFAGSWGRGGALHTGRPDPATEQGGSRLRQLRNNCSGPNEQKAWVFRSQEWNYSALKGKGHFRKFIIFLEVLVRETSLA